MDFLNQEHRSAYYTALEQAQRNDACHKSLFYLVTGNQKLRSKLKQGELYDFEYKMIKPQSIHNHWLPTSEHCLLHLAHNLFTGDSGMSVNDTLDPLDEINTELALNAIQLRYRPDTMSV
ncbi:hypothetical protein JCM16358_00930 [Halanaerocella petrolearia]